jgi:hypothetical protein
MKLNEGHTDNPPSPRRLLLYTFGAAAVATVLSLTIVLPAEYGRDPTGIGELTGLKSFGDGLAGMQTGAVAQYYDTPFRTDVIEIPFVSEGDKSGFSELEYKVRMKAGETLIYSWVAEGAEENEFYFDLHSETSGPDPKVLEFRQATGVRSHGALMAPMEGMHGWYWQNRSPNRVNVRLRLSGFYELIPPGQTGNKAGITPTGDAAAAAPPPQ